MGLRCFVLKVPTKDRRVHLPCVGAYILKQVDKLRQCHNQGRMGAQAEGDAFVKPINCYNQCSQVSNEVF